MAVKRADRRLGRKTEAFLKSNTGAEAPLFVLMCWEGDARADAPAADLHIITNVDDNTALAALDVARSEIDEPGP